MFALCLGLLPDPLRCVQLSHLRSEIVIWILDRAKQSGQPIMTARIFYYKTGEPLRALIILALFQPADPP